MTTESNRYVRGVLELRKNTTEILVIALALALGINLLAAAVPPALGLSSTASLGAGFALCARSVVYLVLRLQEPLSRTIEFEGVLLLGNSNEVMEIERYRFSEETRSHIKGLTAENEALGNAWRRGSLGRCFEGEPDPAQRHTETASQLVREAIEYFTLNELSLHLSAYFDSHRKVPEDSVTRIGRRDIPQVLLDNRFLELFSKPMAERAAFQSDEEPVHGGKVVSATGPHGEVFDHFELVLPKGTTLQRANQLLRLTTSRFSLDIESIYEGFATVLPPDFEELYLGVPFDKYNPHMVNLRLRIAFTWWSLLSARGWDFYEWVDSFTEKLDHAFSFQTFLNDTGWEAAHSVAIVLRNSARTKPDAN